MEWPKKKEALKENRNLFFIMLAISTVLLVLGLAIPADWSIVLTVIGVIAYGWSFYYFFNGIIRIRRSHCPKCSTYYDYDKYDIQWDETERNQCGNKVYSHVDFSCVCPRCGKEQRYSKRVIYAVYNKDKDSWEKRDLHQQIKEFFWHGA